MMRPITSFIRPYLRYKTNHIMAAQQNIEQKSTSNDREHAETKNKTYSRSNFLKRKMWGWQIHSYGGLEELEFSNKIKIPVITSSSKVIVKINASSVNPIDVAMISGYGSNLLNIMRNHEIEFPLVLGRDFAGEIIHKAIAVKLDIGDAVWGVVPVHQQGCHSEFIAVNTSYLSRKPDSINEIAASSILYSGLTAWSGLFVSGQLGSLCDVMQSRIGSGQGKRVLVLGASGGVGSIAIQILKAENAIAIATCSTDAINFVQSIGADHIIDYTKEEAHEELVKCGPYNIILDCAGKGVDYANALPWTFDNYVTFSSPLLTNIDQFGVGSGMLRNFVHLIENNSRFLTKKQGSVKWGYFIPAPQGIEYLKRMVDDGKLIPIIDETYRFEKANEAYKRVSDGHLRGKIVLDLN